jgi:hypothetical protein
VFLLLYILPAHLFGGELKPGNTAVLSGKRLSSMTYSASRDEIYVVDSLTGDILVGNVDREKFIKLELREGIKVYAIDSGENSDLYVTDLDKNFIYKLDPHGRVQIKREIPSLESGLPLGRVRVDPSGKILVVERSGRTIHLFDKDLGSLGFVKLDSFPDSLALVDVNVLAGDTIVALSSKGEVVRFYGPGGEYLRGFGVHGMEPGSFSLPSSFTIGPDGFLWIIDSFKHSVNLYETSGAFVVSMLDMKRSGRGLYFPVDIDFLGGKRVAILDKGTSSIKVFEVAGNTRK